MKRIREEIRTIFYTLEHRKLDRETKDVGKQVTKKIMCVAAKGRWMTKWMWNR